MESRAYEDGDQRSNGGNALQTIEPCKHIPHGLARDSRPGQAGRRRASTSRSSVEVRSGLSCCYITLQIARTRFRLSLSIRTQIGAISSGMFLSKACPLVPIILGAGMAGKSLRAHGLEP